MAKNRQQCNFFFQNHIHFDSWTITLGLSSFLNVFKRENVNVLNLKKKSKMMAPPAHFFFFLIFFKFKNSFFYGLMLSETTQNQRVSTEIKVDVIWHVNKIFWLIVANNKKYRLLSTQKVLFDGKRLVATSQCCD